MIKIGSNIASLTAQRQLSESLGRLGKAQEKLASGMRINSAADDAAGLAIASGLNLDSRVFGQAMRNANDAISALSIADSALDQLASITTRRMELAEQSANGVYSAKQRDAASEEMTALVREYNRIVQTTAFNGRNLFETENGELRIQVGYGVTGSLAIDIGEVLAATAHTGVFTTLATVMGESTMTQSAVAADLNGDGFADLISSGMGSTGGEITVRLGAADGTFTTSDSFTGLGFAVKNVKLVDLNNDGQLDLVSAGQNTDGGNFWGELNVWLAGAGGTFGSYQTITAENMDTASVAYGDINGDGRIELVTGGQTQSGAGEVSVYSNNGAGVFNKSTSYAVGQIATYAVALGDMNGDGSLDVVAGGIGDAMTGTATILSNNGSGTFGSAQSLNMNALIVNAITLADADGNGSLDIVSAGQSTDAGMTTFWGEASVRLNSGEGSFGAALATRQEGFSSNTVVMSDVDGDGILDLITGGSAELGAGPGQVTVRNGLGDGTFSEATVYSVNAFNTISVQLADIDGDGAAELLAAGDNNGVPGTISVLKESIVGAIVSNLSIATQPQARTTLDQLSQTLDRISSERGALGAFMSRIEVALGALGSRVENSRAAASRIQDADIAVEAANALRENILQNVGSRILAQANLSPEIALMLLRG